MLVPALLYKDKLLELFAKEMYTDNYFLYMGYLHGHQLPNITDEDCTYQWAIINSNDEVIGYLSYRIYGDSVINFGLYSFDRGNPIVGKELFNKMEELAKNYHRIEWHMVGGNPVKKHYDKFCQKYNGNVIVLHDVMKDSNGNYRDEYIYEIINDKVGGKE